MKDQEKKFCLYNDLEEIYNNDYNYSGISFSYSFDNIDCIVINDVEILVASNIEIGLGQHHLHFIIYDEECHFIFQVEYNNIKNFVLRGVNNVDE